MKMKIKSEQQNNLESKSLKSKVKEITAISLFTLAAAIASIILADLIVFPLTRFAVENVNIYNLIFKNVLMLFIIIILLLSLIRKFRKLADEGLSVIYILFYLLKRPLHYGGLFLSFLFISILLIFVLYLLFNTNYYYLYKISGGV